MSRPQKTLNKREINRLVSAARSYRKACNLSARSVGHKMGYIANWAGSRVLDIERAPEKSSQKQVFRYVHAVIDCADEQNINMRRKYAQLVEIKLPLMPL